MRNEKGIGVAGGIGLIVLILVAIYYVVKHPMEVSKVDKGYTIMKTEEAGKREKGQSKKKKKS